MVSDDLRHYVLGRNLECGFSPPGPRLRAATTSSMRSRSRTLPRPCTSTRYEERRWVVERQFTLWPGNEQVQLRSGAYYAIPLNTPHAIKASVHGGRSLVISSPAGFAELIARAATPAHLAGPDTEIHLELFASVSAELGDQILGPPGTIPADL
jgi:hypothetical protein